MPINTNALPSAFNLPSKKEREAKVEESRRAACFYTLRSLLWQQGKAKIFRDAKERGTITPIAPGVRQPDGSYSREEYDPDEIAQVYAEAWEEFTISFDAAFIHATSAELVEYAQDKFDMGLNDLLALNAERSAARFKR